MKKSSAHQLLEKLTKTEIPESFFPTEKTTANQLADILADLRKKYDGKKYEDNFCEVLKSCVKLYNDKYPDRFDQDIFDPKKTGNTIYEKIDNKTYNPANFMHLLFSDDKIEDDTDPKKAEEFDLMFEEIMFSICRVCQDDSPYGIYAVMATIIQDKFFKYRSNYLYPLMTSAFVENLKGVLSESSPYYNKPVEHGSGLSEHIVREKMCDLVRTMNADMKNRKPQTEDENSFEVDHEPELRFYLEIEYEDFNGRIKKILVDPEIEYIYDDKDEVVYRPRSHWCGTHFFDSFRVDYWCDVQNNKWVMVPLRLIQNLNVVQDVVYGDNGY